MAGAIYRKPISFALMAAVSVLIGSIVTMAYPMLRPEMHPRLDSLQPFTALQLAGRDIYQREGCVGCHTQTVRPLRSEVVRYGDYSKAGEFYYDRPFLWGSKRTGPDLAREGGKRPDAWHYQHYADPRAIEKRSNMPRYAFLADQKLDPDETRSHMAALGLAHTPAEIAALASRTEMDALVAYTQWLGHAVKRRAGPDAVDLAERKPLGDSPQAIARGHKVFAENCSACHGDEGHGVAQVAPDLLDDRFLEEAGDMPDAAYLAVIRGGSDAKAALGRKGMPSGGMTAFEGQLPVEDMWAVIAFLRAQKAHEGKEAPAMERKEHAPQGGEKRGSP